MCGIAGYWSSSSAHPNVLRAMTDALAHRGPDAHGFFESGPVHLGHRRLSVIDIAGSAQPMTSADGALTVVFNGEIYNFRELRSELASRWHFETDGDTEVLLAGWDAWGEDVLQHLRGMFAFALWDARDESLFLARDHLGVKPLHYAWDGRTFVFGSELKAVMAHPSVSRDIDAAALRLYLESQFIPAPRTILQSARKLPPAHSLRLRNGSLVERRFWRVAHAPKLALSDGEAQDAIDAGLRESISGMLIADVPLGAFVSGGVDSALIAALMTDLTGRPVSTFNIGFAGDGVDSEHREAAAVAQHLGSDHHAIMLEAHDVLAAFDEWVHVFDEPFADQAALPTLLLARLARRNVTVVLTGEGADEVFAGYSNYGKRIAEERVTRWLGHRASPARALVRALPAGVRKDRLLRGIAEPLPRRYRTVPNVFDSTQHRGLLSATMLAATQDAPDIGAHAARAFEQCDSPDYLDRLLYVDTALWLPDDLLTKVDRATMAYSLEARVPYLDHRFYELAVRLEPRQKLRDDVGKHILKRIARRYLPENIVDRPKHGVVMPLTEWLGGPLAAQLREHLDGLAGRGIFRSGVIGELLGAFRSGRRSDAGRLWALFILERWFRRYAPEWRLQA